MLYELVGIARPGNLAEVKEIVLAAGQMVLQQRGVVRGVANWGVYALPKPTSVHQMRHHHGHYFCMRFDSSSKTQQDVRNMLSLDPRMIRHSSVRLAVSGTARGPASTSPLDELARYGAPAWGREE